MFALVAIALAASGASVPQTAADQYVFSRPNLPSNIVGVVMGDPPAYSIPRSEDVAWLREAYAERATLAGDGGWTGLQEVVTLEPKFGIWPLSASNQFERWVTATLPHAAGVNTNIIVGYVAVTNRGAGVDSARISEVDPAYGLAEDLLANTNSLENGFLSTNDDVYVTGARAWQPDDLPPLTNITEKTLWHPYWTNATEVLTMAMTNGTTSVFTNSWTVFAPTAAVIVATNVTYRDFVWVPALFTNFVVVGHGRSYPGTIKGVLDSAAFTNHYAFLRGCRRLARAATNTNDALGIVSGGWVEGDSYLARTNDLATALPWVSRRATVAGYSGYTNNVDDSVSPPATNWYPYSGTDRQQYFDRTLDGAQPFVVVGLSGAATRPLGVPTIRTARLFAVASMSFHESSLAWIGDTSIGSFSTNLSWKAIVPLGTVEPVSDSSGVGFVAQLDDSILSSAWSAFAGAPTALPMSDTWSPSMRFGVPAGTHQNAGNSSTYMTFEAAVDDLLLLIDLAPRTSLPGWND